MTHDTNGLPILDQYSEEGFVDCVFKISELKHDCGLLRFHISASYEGVEVGLDVALMADIRAGFDDEMELNSDHVYAHGVTMSRSGSESDQFLDIISRLYGHDLPPRRMVDEESYTAIALHQGDIDLISDPIKLKLFGQDSEPFNEDLYNESFFNVDLTAGYVYWNEKDSDYRSGFIDSLTKQ